MIHPDLPIRALAIKQPWASAIIHLGKDIENREWPTMMRGRICIHASKAYDPVDAADFHDLVYARNIDMTGKPNLYFPEEPRGGIIGVVEIADCVTRHNSDWFVGRYGFVLRNARPVEFIPVRGALGFFDWRRSVL